MSARLTAALSGDLTINRDPGTCPGAADPGCSFTLGLLSVNRTGTIEQSNNLLPIDASGGAVALPFPVGLSGKVIYIKVFEGGPMDIVVTHATQGVTTYPVKGTFLLEVSDDELISAVSVATGGVGTIEWAIWG